jgi:hypothetical protein
VARSRHRQAADVDQVRGLLDVELHQVQQVGAAGDEPGALGQRRRLRRRPGLVARS